MAERVIFSTQELTRGILSNPVSFDFLDRRLLSARATFDTDFFAEFRMQKDSKSGELHWVDIMAIDLRKGICCYYDHGFWPQPFETVFLPEELSGFYPAVVHFSSARLKQKDIVSFPVKYGTFWYDETGKVKAVNAAHLTRRDLDRNNPLLNLIRVNPESWYIYRRNDVYDFPKQPEEKLLEDGQEFLCDEIVTNLADDGQTVTLQQRSLTGHIEKIIQVPSQIEIPRWVDILQGHNGDWVNVFARFPSKITLSLGTSDPGSE